MYPEYKEGSIILAGEGYAAKYLSMIDYKVDHYNWLQDNNVLPEDIVHVNLIQTMMQDP